MPVVSNSSPLIALDQINQLGLLPILFGDISIPIAVVREIPTTVSSMTWIQKKSVARLLPEAQLPSLGAGEREAICLAVELRASALIMDDEPARNVAKKLNLPVIGAAAVLILAKERPLIPSVRSC